MKRRADFHFKQFSISHDRSTHKIGTDGVLLGAWVEPGSAQNILDIGTGTGVIALMLAQRTGENVHIDAVEIEGEDVSQAMENVQRSPWPGKVSVIHTSLQKFVTEKRYDLIVSNPPYFINSWRPPDERRSKARHAHNLSYDELLQQSLSLLRPDGRLAVILPYEEGLQFITSARTYDLHPLRQLHFRSRANKPVERVVVELSRISVQSNIENLILHADGENWSEPYKALTRDFYLKA